VASATFGATPSARGRPPTLSFPLLIFLFFFFILLPSSLAIKTLNLPENASVALGLTGELELCKHVINRDWDLAEWSRVLVHQFNIMLQEVELLQMPLGFQ
jgi:hypothetical protein